jgi:hypothetical protein
MYLAHISYVMIIAQELIEMSGATLAATSAVAFEGVTSAWGTLGGWQAIRNVLLV